MYIANNNISTVLTELILLRIDRVTKRKAIRVVDVNIKPEPKPYACGCMRNNPAPILTSENIARIRVSVRALSMFLKVLKKINAAIKYEEKYTSLLGAKT